ncbi:unnamed protein product [Musa hybrid cultivar]
MWDAELVEMRVCFEVCIEYRDELVVPGIVATHCWFQIPSFVTSPNHSMPIDDVYASLTPLGNLCSDQEPDTFIVGIIQQSVFRPVHLADSRNRRINLAIKAHINLSIRSDGKSFARVPYARESRCGLENNVAVQFHRSRKPSVLRLSMIEQEVWACYDPNHW